MQKRSSIELFTKWPLCGIKFSLIVVFKMYVYVDLFGVNRKENLPITTVTSDEYVFQQSRSLYILFIIIKTRKSTGELWQISALTNYCWNCPLWPLPWNWYDFIFTYSVCVLLVHDIICMKSWHSIGNIDNLLFTISVGKINSNLVGASFIFDIFIYINHIRFL